MSQASAFQISVGIPAFNAARTLPQLLDSLLVQTRTLCGVEIVVADNMSTDQTPDIVRQYSSRGPVRLVHARQRRGPSAARNAVVAATTAPLIAFVDADCIAHPAWLATVESGFNSPSVGCVAGAIAAGPAHSAIERFYARHGILGQEHVLANPFLPYAQTANTTFRRSVFEATGAFDEDLPTCEDADFLWRMQLHTSFSLAYLPDALVWHQHRTTVRALLRQTMGWGAGEARLFAKYRPAMPRQPASRVLADYRRMAGLARLSTERWLSVRFGHGDPEAFADAGLSLLYKLGMRVGRLRGSVSAGVFYP